MKVPSRYTWPLRYLTCAQRALRPLLPRAIAVGVSLENGICANETTSHALLYQVFKSGGWSSRTMLKSSVCPIQEPEVAGFVFL